MSAAQHLDDLIVAQRKLLWPLSPAERFARIAEIRADYEYENQLSAVAQAMSEEKIEEAEADAQGGMTGAAVVVVIVEALGAIAFIAAAIFWSGIGSGAI